MYTRCAKRNLATCDTLSTCALLSPVTIVRGVLGTKQKENNAAMIPRRSVEGKTSSTSTKTSPADCQTSAVRVGHHALNLHSTIDGHGEQISDETHRMRSDRLRLSPPPGNWQAIAESVYANISAKTQLLYHRHMRTCENMPALC